ncbi:hypothetical protein [Comamonas composti]|uniref:hypothetical protein n=1 Tax=Comamonas composti TaxID=408558 RepID=UPI000402BFBE|nr:hypothetical protein [Comamonas composti]
MIEVTGRNGRAHLLSPDGIIRIEEAGVSSQWHGIRCYIKTFDGAIIECQQSVQEVQKLLQSLELSRLGVGAA